MDEARAAQAQHQVERGQEAEEEGAHISVRHLLLHLQRRAPRRRTIPPSRPPSSASRPRPMPTWRGCGTRMGVVTVQPHRQCHKRLQHPRGHHMAPVLLPAQLPRGLPLHLALRRQTMMPRGGAAPQPTSCLMCASTTTAVSRIKYLSRAWQGSSLTPTQVVMEAWRSNTKMKP